MKEERLRQLVDEVIVKDKWADFLRRFIDVLRINIFVVDYSGKVIVAPLTDGERGRYGSKFLARTFNFDFSGEFGSLIDGFKQQGSYFERKDSMGLHVFAIPVKTVEDDIIAYLVVGPVILNKRLDSDEYARIADELNIKSAYIMDALQEIRVLSFLSIKAILDLLADVMKDIVGLRLENSRPSDGVFQAEEGELPPEIAQAAEGLYSPINLKELLNTILDTAVNLTHAERGSVMFLDPKRKELSIRVSHGFDSGKFGKQRVKLGEGIAGIAARDNVPFVISKDGVDSRIKEYLNQPQVKQSAVIPLSSQEGVFGVLNISTTDPKGTILSNEANLMYFSKLISSAIPSL